MKKTLIDFVNDFCKFYDADPSAIFNSAMGKYKVNHKMKMSNHRPIIRSRLISEQKHECYYCHKYISHKMATIDHKQPLVRGGSDTKENMVASCSVCNTTKGAMNEVEFSEFQDSFNGRSTRYKLNKRRNY